MLRCRFNDFHSGYNKVGVVLNKRVFIFFFVIHVRLVCLSDSNCLVLLYLLVEFHSGLSSVLCLLHRIVFRIPSKGNLIQSLTTPLVHTTTFDKIRAGAVGLDGPKFQNRSDSPLDSSTAVAQITVRTFYGWRWRRSSFWFYRFSLCLPERDDIASVVAWHGRNKGLDSPWHHCNA